MPLVITLKSSDFWCNFSLFIRWFLGVIYGANFSIILRRFFGTGANFSIILRRFFGTHICQNLKASSNLKLSCFSWRRKSHLSLLWQMVTMRARWKRSCSTPTMELLSRKTKQEKNDLPKRVIWLSGKESNISLLLPAQVSIWVCKMVFWTWTPVVPAEVVFYCSAQTKQVNQSSVSRTKTEQNQTCKKHIKT